MTDNANVDALFSSIRSLLIVLGTILAGYGMTNTGWYFWIEAGAGSIMVIGPAAWGVYVAFTNLLKQRKAVAVGVQSGINLVATGNALAADGAVISVNSGMTPPKPVTIKSAQEIVRNFAPSTPPVEK